MGTRALNRLTGVFAGMLLAVASGALAQTYNIFHPGGALSGTWNSQNVNLAAGAPFIAGTLPDGSLSANIPLLNAANSFTGTTQTISSAEPRFRLNQTGAGTDLKLWDVDVASGVLCIRTRTDADATGQNVFCATRGTTTTLTNETFGYSTAGTYTFPFTGTATFSGAVSANGRLAFGATTVGASGNSFYLSGTNTFGLSTGGTQRGTIDANGSLNWAFAITSAGTKPTVTGCSNTTTLGGAVAGSYVSGISGTCTVTITLPTGPTNGYACFAHDDTTSVDYTQSAIVTAVTTLTISGTTVTGDKIVWGCPLGY